MAIVDRTEHTSLSSAVAPTTSILSPARTSSTAAACATCGHTGKAVETITVQALLALPLTEMRGDDYRFCAQADCPTVYYGSDRPGGSAGADGQLDQPGQQHFREEALRERVHQKHPGEDNVFVCYCFRHTPDSIRAELQATGRSTVVERVTAGIKAERCACEVRNPQGSCCLGNVHAVVKRLETAPATASLASASR